ncbi:hypothetical protein [Fibrella aquatilis]|uniref:Uncharacterized protein n=1 Tax=Fibrella aquatilis TaxID=2817059 RepID=A0A939JWQ7_9BACT|nr:hypothetical protein [Fibrella aquatilis]MBO0930249.1 hypothetical protein [Fibrella aquatilis]
MARYQLAVCRELARFVPGQQGLFQHRIQVSFCFGPVNVQAASQAFFVDQLRLSEDSYVYPQSGKRFPHRWARIRSTALGGNQGLLFQ